MFSAPVIRTEIPGPASRKLSASLKKHEAPTVTCFTDEGPIFWKRALDTRVWDVDENCYVDLTSAFGVASLGHSNPRIVAAIQDQSRELCHAMGDVHPTALKADLCAKLSKITFERWSSGKIPAQTLLCNSGFEAVEAALKTAHLFTRKRGVIAFENGYHGLGYGALEATWRQDFRQPFIDQLGHFVDFVPFPRANQDEKKSKTELEALEHQIRNLLRKGNIGAILVEPFQGRGGEVIPPADFLSMLRRICTQARILLIVDEIYVGLWRTGKWFAVDHTSVMPDIICLGKALTGSLPLSACVGRDDIMAAWPRSEGEALHTSTFLGNPLACAAALASIAEFEEAGANLQVAEKGARLLEILRGKLSGNARVKEIRGIGLMVGIEFDGSDASFTAKLCDRLLRKGIIALPSGSKGETLGITPPLTIAMEEMEWAAGEIVAAVGVAT